MGNKCFSVKKGKEVSQINAENNGVTREESKFMSRKLSIASEGDRMAIPYFSKNKQERVWEFTPDLENIPPKKISTANSVLIDNSVIQQQELNNISSPLSHRSINRGNSIENSKKINKSLSNSITIEHYKNMSFLNHALIEFHQKMKIGDMEGFDLIYQDKKSDHKLKIYMKSYITEEKYRVNVFRSDFYVPCSAEFFVRFQNNVPEQTKLDDLLQDYYIIESPYENINLLYLSYKKTLISSPRDFVYLKYFKSLHDEKSLAWIDVSKSVLDERYPPKKNYIRGETICSGHYVEDVTGRENYCFVKQRSEVDFKVNVPLFLVKNFSVGELKKYFEKSIKRIEELQGMKKV